MGKALYRQYRSTSFDEVIGQDHITTTLKNSLSSGSVGHAYLLTGPRGVGKTSVARILAFAVNDLPYESDQMHLDIIEIDAASNRRIDEIRSLRERVHVAPTSGKYKVYIIDEVHMLTREAFNALLKTLEEPPAHVIFILATTEIHKLPDTIVSRCITFTFRPIDPNSIAGHLKHIARSEGYTITDDAIQLLATHGEGSFRDSISLLDQVKNSSDTISVADIELALGLASKETVDAIMASVSNGNPNDLSNTLQQAYNHGASEINVSKQLSELIRLNLLNRGSTLSSDDSLAMLRELLDVPCSPKPRVKLELCLLQQLFKSHRIVASSPSTPEITVPAPAEPELPATTVKSKRPNDATISLTFTETDVQPEKTINQAVIEQKHNKTVHVEIDNEIWSAILQKLKSQNNTLYGVARMAEAELKDGNLLLSFKFPFHFRQVSQAKNKSIITAIIEGLGHKNLELVITQKTDASKPVAARKTDTAIANITNIFGDSEVLES